MELLIGCGRNRDKRIITRGVSEWEQLVTLDHNPEVNPNVVHDLTVMPYPFLEDTFDEIHAYEVLEHIGQQGDYKTFFAQFSEFHRILKPGGLFCATVPMWNNIWAWGDPSHTRVINNGTLVFLSQKEYEKAQGVTSMTDFRYIWKQDFDILMAKEQGENFIFVLQAVKEKENAGT